jgi:hypothetical protein
VAGYIARWQPSSVPAGAARFARAVVTAAAPGGQERAKNLLQSAGKLADYGIGLGLEPVPPVLLHPSVTGRFTAHGPGLSGPARRTLRTNLRFIAGKVVPQLVPADAPLPRERAKAPYTRAEIDGFLALADAQPAAARRMRAAGLVCLGAGAGLIRSDLRAVRGADVICRSGGVLVTVRGPRPRVVPVLARYQDRLLASAAFAGQDLVTGGTDPARRNITTPLARSLSGGTGLPRLEGSRLRATWLAEAAQLTVRPPRSCTPPGSSARSGWATSPPPCRRAPRRRPSRCPAVSGEHPARGAGRHRRYLGRRAPDRGAAAGRAAPPAADHPDLNPGHAARPG